MDAAPVLTESSAAWALRAAWAGRWEVALSTRHGRRHRGYVEHVSPTSAYALLWDVSGLLHVPCALVRAVRRPHEHEPAWGEAVARPAADPREAIALPMAGQLALDVGDGDRPEAWRDPREEAAARAAEVEARRAEHARRRGEGKRRAVAREKKKS